MATLIFETYEDFLLRENKEDNGVSPEFTAKYTNWAKINKTNTGCWECFNCEYCNYCNSCKWCEWCDDCEDCEDLKFKNGLKAKTLKPWQH